MILSYHGIAQMIQEEFCVPIEVLSHGIKTVQQPREGGYANMLKLSLTTVEQEMLLKFHLTSIPSWVRLQCTDLFAIIAQVGIVRFSVHELESGKNLELWVEKKIPVSDPQWEHRVMMVVRTYLRAASHFQDVLPHMPLDANSIPDGPEHAVQLVYPLGESLAMHTLGKASEKVIEQAIQLLWTNRPIFLKAGSRLTHQYLIRAMATKLRDQGKSMGLMKYPVVRSSGEGLKLGVDVYVFPEEYTNNAGIRNAVQEVQKQYGVPGLFLCSHEWEECTALPDGIYINEHVEVPTSVLLEICLDQVSRSSGGIGKKRYTQLYDSMTTALDKFGSLSESALTGLVNFNVQCSAAPGIEENLRVLFQLTEK